MLLTLKRPRSDQGRLFIPGLDFHVMDYACLRPGAYDLRLRPGVKKSTVGGTLKSV